VFRPLLAIGDATYGGRYRCSLGFNLVQGSTFYFLTAGHCGEVANTWYNNSGHITLIGPTIDHSFPANDYALVRYDNRSLSHPGGFTSANACVGETVKRTGSTTGTQSGTAIARNVTVPYQGGGTVSGMIQTNVCAEPGDSGGPLYDGTKALGITSGGSGHCQTGGTTFYQPVIEAGNQIQRHRLLTSEPVPAAIPRGMAAGTRTQASQEQPLRRLRQTAVPPRQSSGSPRERAGTQRRIGHTTCLWRRPDRWLGSVSGYWYRGHSNCSMTPVSTCRLPVSRSPRPPS